MTDRATGCAGADRGEIMIKMAGCFLIVYASFAAGHAVGQTHVRMVREMEELLLFTQMIKSRIAYAGCELPEIMSDCEERLNGSLRIWIGRLCCLLAETPERRFSETWKESVTVLEDISALRPDVLGEVDRLGSVLGDMDVESQLAQIALIEGAIEERYRRETSKSDGIRRLSSSLGILGGLFIVLVLV